jgi:hypothetical protein
MSNLPVGGREEGEREGGDREVFHHHEGKI